jgi:hypothetical protein
MSLKYEQCIQSLLPKSDKHLTLELTQPARAAFDIIREDEHEREAIAGLGSMSCYGGAHSFRRAERPLISISRVLANTQCHVCSSWVDSAVITFNQSRALSTLLRLFNRGAAGINVESMGSADITLIRRTNGVL